MVFILLGLFFAIIIFSIILNAYDMAWQVDFTGADAKDKLLALKLDGVEIRRYRRRQFRSGWIASDSNSLSDYVQIPLDAPIPNYDSFEKDASSAGENSWVDETFGSGGKVSGAAKAIRNVARGTAAFAAQEMKDLLVVFGTKDGKEHKIFYCDFTLDRLELAKEIVSVLGGST
ncbi:MAG: hypothetical protein IKQ23_06950 [Treponema sp.]|nr:hypothetical protein [Treponema sp.]MBR6144005.1 hypothetical protein [Treponema sp.]